MIHIVFQRSDVGALQKSFELDPSLQGEVVEIADDFAVGPLGNLNDPVDWDARRQWWRDVLHGGDYQGAVDDGSVADDVQTVIALKEKLRLEPELVAWIWMAPNKHDVSGYYWLTGQLSEFQGRIFILYLHNLPFISDKGSLFYPVNLSELPAREFVKARKLAQPVSPGEFETEADEWGKLCRENTGVRLLEGAKKLVSAPYTLFDAELLKFIGTDWIKANRLIHQFLAKAKQTTGDAYLLWRLKQLIAEGKLEMQGDGGKMKDFEVRHASGTSVNTNMPNT